MKTKTIILDDHTLFADGLSLILSDIDEIELVKIVHNSEDLFSILQQQKINLLLLDIQLKEENGMELCPRIKEINPNIKIILISMFDYNDLQLEIKKSDANGFIPKSTNAENVKLAIKDIIKGEDTFLQSETYSFSPQPYFNLITSREKEIIALIKAGNSSKQISEQLCISHYTVDTHRKNILKKLNLNSIKDLIAFAINNNL